MNAILVGREEWRRELGQRIREARERAGLHQQEVANALGVSKQLVSHWHHGHNEITAFHLVRLATVLKSDVQWLLTGRRHRTVPYLPSPPDLLEFARQVRSKSITLGYFLEVTAKEKMGVISSVSGIAIAVPAFDTAMEPTIPLASRIVIDPKRVPKRNDIALIVLMATGELLLRRFIPDVRAKFRLRADNPTFFRDRRVSSDHDPHVLGTAVEVAYQLNEMTSRISTGPF